MAVLISIVASLLVTGLAAVAIISSMHDFNDDDCVN
jgi:hypothetical protein